MVTNTHNTHKHTFIPRQDMSRPLTFHPVNSHTQTCTRAFYLVNFGHFLLSLPVSLDSQHHMSTLFMLRDTVFVLSFLNRCILEGYTDPSLCILRGQIASTAANHTAVTQGLILNCLARIIIC